MKGAGAEGRGLGPGSGDQDRSRSSSRMKSRSADESVTGSFANGDSLFSRLFSAHVKDAPLEVTTVPSSGFASTFTHGRGVWASPSRTIVYSRPPAENPPRPFANVSSGTASSTGGGVGCGGRGALRGPGDFGSGYGRASWLGWFP